ncbi:MAG: hypothetical protein HY731_05385 [Candidatus Tectomicrobia bacterium]|nr:hypothetical protein [Candidatus Tectomicrobia bacterium]
MTISRRDQQKSSGISRRRFLQLTAGAAGVFGLGGGRAFAGAAPQSGAKAPKYGGQLKYGTIGDSTYGSMDVTTTTGTFDLENALSLQDSLIHMTPDWQLVPGLAESWTVSDDKLIYTFKLREGVKFHDGTSLDAQAIKFNFDRMSDAKRNPSGLSRSYLGPTFAGTEVVDKLTFRFTLTKPNPLFLLRMRRAYFSPQSPAAIEKWGDEYFRHPVSVGPFKFVEWAEHDHIIVEANPDYAWAPPQLFKHQGRPYLDRVYYRIITDVDTRVAALESGELDFIAGIGPQDAIRLKDSKNIGVIIRDQMGQSTNLDLNTEKPPTNELEVRKAIEYAIDKETLTKKVLFGINTPAWHFMTPTLWSYDPSLTEMYKFDQAKSKDILEKAGWKVASDGIRVKDGNRLSLLWITSQEALPVAQFVQAQLKQIGIDAQIQTLAGAGLIEAITKGQHNIAGGVGGWIQEDPDVIRSWAHSSYINVRQNNIRARDAELDKLLEEGISINAPLHGEDRAAIYRKIQRRIMENAYTVPLFYRKSIEAARSQVNLDNIGYDPYGTYHYFYEVFLG